MHARQAGHAAHSSAADGRGLWNARERRARGRGGCGTAAQSQLKGACSAWSLGGGGRRRLPSLSPSCPGDSGPSALSSPSPPSPPALCSAGRTQGWTTASVRRPRRPQRLHEATGATARHWPHRSPSLGTRCKSPGQTSCDDSLRMAAPPASEASQDDQAVATLLKLSPRGPPGSSGRHVPDAALRWPADQRASGTCGRRSSQR